MMMIDVDAKIKKKKGAEYFERPEDLDSDWVKQHQEAEVEELRQKIIKKFEKDNEKLKADGDKEMKPKELDERLLKADELADKYKKENKTGKIEAEGKGPTVEKLEGNVEKIVQRIENMKVQMDDKEGNKEVALGTSKIVSHCPAPLSNSMLMSARTTLTPVLLLSSRRSSMFPSSASSPRHCARSSTGPSSPSTRIGSSRPRQHRHFAPSNSLVRLHSGSERLVDLPRRFVGGLLAARSMVAGIYVQRVNALRMTCMSGWLLPFSRQGLIVDHITRQYCFFAFFRCFALLCGCHLFSHTTTIYLQHSDGGQAIYYI